jgi:hypothetical protein
MNFALPAVVVFILMLPGFVARSRLKRTERRQLDYAPFGQIVTEALVWTCLLHVAWLQVCQALTGLRFNPGLAVGLFSSDAKRQAQALDTVASQAPEITAYLGSLTLLAYLLPSLLRWAITRWRLDREGSLVSPWCRFSDAPWYYLLSGADFEAEDMPDIISISATMELGNDTFLFTGILDSYECLPDGTLDRLMLEQATRQPLGPTLTALPHEDQAPQARLPETQEGDLFVLRYAQVLTLGIEYLKLAPQPQKVPG